MGPVEPRTYASDWTNNVTAAVTAKNSNLKTRAALLKLTDGRAIAFCFLVKTNATDPHSVLIDLEAIAPSLP